MSGRPVTVKQSAAAVVPGPFGILAILRRDTGHWEIPGGVVEPNESPYDACVREVLEETGLRCEPQMLSGVYWNTNRLVTELVFLASPSAAQPSIAQSSTEALRVGWLSPAECSRLMVPAFYIRVQDALAACESDRGAPFRRHNGREVGA